MKTPTNQRPSFHKSLRVILVISMLLNLLLILALIAVFYAVRTTETAQYNALADYRCSDQWDQEIIDQTTKSPGATEDDVVAMVAVNDYHCQKNGAAEYYQRGLDQYLESRNIQLDEK